MKKWKSILLAVLAVGSLASCEGGKEATISKQEAANKIKAVTDEMGKASGFSVKANANYEYSNSYTYDKVTMEESGKYSASADTIFLFNEETLTGAQCLIDLNYEGKNSDGTTTGEIGFDFFIKEAYAYSHILVNESMKSPDVEEPEVYNEDLYGVTSLESLLESIDSITGSIGEIDEETSAMIKQVIENLPDPTIKSSKGTDTITWAITDDDLNKAITALLTSTMVPEIELPGDISIPDGISIPTEIEIPSEYMDQINAEIQAMVDEIDKMIDIKTLEFSISLADGKYVSNVGAKIDIQINNEYTNDDGEVIESTTSKIKCELTAEIKLLASDATITYPEDLDTWATKNNSDAA